MPTVAEFINKVGFQVKNEDISKVNSTISDIKSMANRVLGTIGIALSVSGITNAIKGLVALSSEAEEMQNKFNVVFQGMTEDVEAWAQSYSDAIGRNKNDIKTYLADQQNLLVGFGMSRQEGFELSKQMTTLALDLASFANLNETQAVNWMTKAIMGESEAAKQLGAVLNDSTREQAMHALGYQGTYESLDQLSKMQVNYQAILSQSPDAIGDCERSLNSYASTMKQYQSKVKEIKTLLGQFFMPTVQKILKYGTQGLTLLRDVVQRVNNFATSIGGAERIIVIFTGALAILFAYIKRAQIAKLITNISQLASNFSFAKLKIVGLIAAFVLLALLIEDFISFMRGDDSLFGSLLEKAGIDADEFREKITNAFTNIKEFVLPLWQGFTDAFRELFTELRAFWNEWGDEILGGIGSVLGVIGDAIASFVSWATGSEEAKDIMYALGKGIAQLAAGFAIAIPLIKTMVTVGNAVSAVFGIITAHPIVAAIAALIAIIVLLIKNWDKVKEVALKVWDWIKGVWSSVADWFKSNVIDPVVGFFTGLWDSISTIIGNIKESIVSGFQAAVDWIKGLPNEALTWGKDIILGIVGGIKSAISKVGDAVGEVAGKIKDFLGFSEPEDGPLSNFHTYMPDMIDLMSKGIRNGRKKIKAALGELATDMSIMVNAGTVSPATTGVMNSSVSNRSVVQNVNINNQFNGDRAIQKDASRAMDKSAKDSTAEMARALVFAK